eukprot:m51a1_g15 hypothetical protein (459) ;mRNA; f:80716-82210
MPFALVVGSGPTASDAERDAIADASARLAELAFSQHPRERSCVLCASGAPPQSRQPSEDLRRTASRAALSKDPFDLPAALSTLCACAPESEAWTVVVVLCACGSLQCNGLDVRLCLAASMDRCRVHCAVLGPPDSPASQCCAALSRRTGGEYWGETSCHTFTPGVLSLGSRRLSPWRGTLALGHLTAHVRLRPDPALSLFRVAASCPSIPTSLPPSLSVVGFVPAGAMPCPVALVQMAMYAPDAPEAPPASSSPRSPPQPPQPAQQQQQQPLLSVLHQVLWTERMCALVALGPEWRGSVNSAGGVLTLTVLPPGCSVPGLGPVHELQPLSSFSPDAAATPVQLPGVVQFLPAVQAGGLAEERPVPSVSSARLRTLFGHVKTAAPGLHKGSLPELREVFARARESASAFHDPSFSLELAELATRWAERQQADGAQGSQQWAPILLSQAADLKAAPLQST